MRSDNITEADAFNGASVLVTGGCGFIGSHLADALVAGGAAVCVLDNLRAGSLVNLSAVREAVAVEVADVRDADRVREIVGRRRPEYVFHLAANASVPGSVEDPAYDFEANSAGTFTLLSALREVSPGTRMLLASSGAVYGQPKTFPITEEAMVDPISPYGASKAGAELTAKIFHRVYGVPTVIARICNTYGPRMARYVMFDFWHKLQRDPAALEVLGDGKQLRDFTYVSDTVRGLMLLAQRGTPAEAYNVSSGRSYSVTEVAHAMIAALGLTGQTHITYTGSSWRGDAQRWEIANDKIRGLGFAPRVSLSEGLENTIRWFQESTDET